MSFSGSESKTKEKMSKHKLKFIIYYVSQDEQIGYSKHQKTGLPKPGFILIIVRVLMLALESRGILVVIGGVLILKTGPNS